MPEPTRLVSSLEMKPTDLKVPRLKPRRSHQVIFGGFPWDFDGILMGISWDFHGILMVFLRDFDGFFTGFWWDFHGNMMGFWWESHGNSGIIDGNLLTNQYHPAQNYPTLLNWKTHILKLKPSNIDNDDLLVKDADFQLLWLLPCLIREGWLMVTWWNGPWLIKPSNPICWPNNVFLKCAKLVRFTAPVMISWASYARSAVGGNVRGTQFLNAFNTLQLSFARTITRYLFLHTHHFNAHF